MSKYERVNKHFAMKQQSINENIDKTCYSKKHNYTLKYALVIIIIIISSFGIIQ